MLKFVLPKGSLERATMQLFADSALNVRRSSEVDYRATIDDPRIDDVRILRPQEIATYVDEGLFDCGITGRDWIEETSAEVESIGELDYSKNTDSPIRVVLAVAEGSPYRTIADLPSGVRVSSELPELTKRYFERHGIAAQVRNSHGATEAKIPDIADAIVDLTETGRALRAAGLRIIDTVLTSKTELIANKAACADPAKRHAMEQIYTLLRGTLAAQGKVLVKLNVAADRIDAVTALLPAAKSPTVSKLWNGDYAVESVVAKSSINTLIPALSDAGASDILEVPLAKIVP